MSSKACLATSSSLVLLCDGTVRLRNTTKQIDKHKNFQQETGFCVPNLLAFVSFSIFCCSDGSAAPNRDMNKVCYTLRQSTIFAKNCATPVLR
uniref:Putative secreted protein n=1 Tax=Ixodes ricinus TaxID=34613 RepID=A0A6B0U519_IXORI